MVNRSSMLNSVTLLSLSAVFLVMLLLKKSQWWKLFVYSVLLSVVMVGRSNGQSCTGSLGDPIFKETFGEAPTSAKPTLGPPLPAGVTNYVYYAPEINDPVGPYPGQYTISNTTRGYNNPYFVDRPDHTSTDGRGFCMVVDAEATPGKFYERTITGLCAGTTFEFSVWMMNANPSIGVSQPSLRFDIVDANNPGGPVITSVSTGQVPYQAPGTWVRQAGVFQMPATTNAVILRIFSNTPSSYGNDLALDDIAFAACGPSVTFGQAPGVVCGGGTAELNVSVPVGSYSSYFFQLQKRSIGSINWTNEGGVVNNGGNNQHTFTVSNASAGFEYRVLVAGGAAEINNVSCRVASGVVELKVVDYTTSITGQQPICYNTATQLSAIVTPKAGTGTPATGFSYVWETSANGSTGWTTIVGQNTATLNTGALTASRYYRVTASVNGCNGDGASQPFLVTVSPALMATLGTVTDICAGTTVFSLPYSITSGSPDRYSISSSNMPGFTPPNNVPLTGSPIRVAVPDNVPAGTYNFTLTLSNNGSGCTTISLPFTVRIDAAPTMADAGPAQNLCATTATLAANPATVGVGTWTQVDGPGTAVFADLHNPATTVSGLVSGVYIFRWTITNGTCPSTANNVQITIAAPPTVANAGPDQIQYNSGIFNMKANTPVIGNGHWTVVSGTATIQNPNDPQTEVTLASNTTATLAWTITNGGCPPSVDQVMLTYTGKTDIRVNKTIVNAGPYLAGQNMSYEIDVTNLGPSTATNVHITDVLPAGFVATNLSFTTNGAAQILQNNSTLTNIDLNASIPVGVADVAIMVEGHIKSSFDGNLTNIAAATSLVELDPKGTATGMITVPVTRRPYFDVVKTAPSSAVAGDVIHFGITVDNKGLGNAEGAVITDVISSQLSNVSWSAVSTGTVQITSGNTGTGNNIRLVADMPGNDTGKIYISVTGTVNADATGTILNTATVTATEPTVPPATSNTTSTRITSSPGLVVDKSRTSAVIAIAGTRIDYVLTLRNNGPSDAVGTVMTDSVPAMIQNVSWTTAAQGAAAITAGASGTGNRISVTGNIPAGASNRIIVYVTGTVSADYAGTILNRVTAKPSEPGVPPVTADDIATVQKSLQFNVRKNGPATSVAGQQLSYTVDVTNQGPSNSTATVIRDNVPLSLNNVSWTTAVVQGTATVQSGATGTGNVVEVTANINAGATIRVTITGTILPSTVNAIRNTAQVVPVEPNQPAVTSNEIITTIQQQAALQITKTGPDTANAGAMVTYIITAGNNGPSNVKGVQITDVVPAAIQNVTWSAVANGNTAISGATSGTGNNIALTGNIAAGSGNTITITVHGQVSPDFSGQVSNMAVITPVAGTGTADTATKVTNVRRQPRLTVSKTAVNEVLAGDSITYTIEVNNTSTANAQGVTIADLVPAQIIGVSWTATATGVATVTNGATGTGNQINVVGNIPAGIGNKITITVKGKTNPAFDGTVVNTATVTSSELPAPISASKSVKIRKIPTLSITKSGPSALGAGSPIVYTIVVTNTGASDATNLLINDLIPDQVQQVTWTATTTGAAVITAGQTGSGNHLSVTGNINGGGNNAIVITVNGVVDPAFNGTFQNTASFQPSEPGAAPGTSNPVVTTVTSKPSLRIVKSGPTKANAGENIIYTLQVTNNGPSNAISARITDQLPALLANTTWTATASGGATISAGATGTGNALGVTASIPARTGLVIITINTHIPSSTADGSIKNFAVVTPAEPGNPAVNSDTVITVIGQKPGLLITKMGPATANAGEQITYTIRAVNVGPSDAYGAVIRDTIPAAVQNPTWTAVTTGGDVVSGAVSGTGNIIQITTDLIAGEQNVVDITVTGTLRSDYAGQLTNKVTITPAEPGLPPVSSQVTTTVSRRAVLRIRKTGPAELSAGNLIRYDIDVTNNGPGTATNVTIKDILPAGIINATWVATAQNGAVITSGNTGSGDIQLLADIPAVAGAAVNIVVTGKVDPGFSGPSITNTAIALNDRPVTPVGDTATVLTTISRLANLRIAKSGPANKGAGEQMQYLISVQNAGPANAVGVIVNDILPAALLNPTWTATGTGNVTNISQTTGTGNVNLTADIPADGSVLNIWVTGTLDPATVDGTEIANTATVSLPAGSPVVDPYPGDNTSTIHTKVDNDPIVRIAKGGPAVASIGDTILYQIIVTNGGAGDITGALIEDNVPADVHVTGWTAVGTGTATVTGATSGTGNTISTTGDIPVGNNSIRIEIYGVIGKTAGTTITNLATVTAGKHKEGSITTAINNSTDVRIVKNGPAKLLAGQAISYTLQVYNDGPRDAHDLLITDQIPSAITGVTWEAVATGDATVLNRQTVDSSGNVINLPATLAAGPGNYITIYVNGIVSGATTAGVLTNTANVAVNGLTDYNPANNTSTVTTNIVTSTDVQVKKTGPAQAVAGNGITYSVVVTNSGPSDAIGLNINDMVPGEVTGTSWVVAVNGAATVTGPFSGNTNNIATTVNIPGGSGNSVVITVTGTLNSDFNGTILNKAIVTGTGIPAVSDSVLTQVDREFSLNICKSGPASVTAGGMITYVINLSNQGPGYARNIAVTDTIDSRIHNVTWTAQAQNGATINSGGSGNGALVALNADIPAGGDATVVITVTGTVDADATGTLTNTATATPPGTHNPPVVSPPVVTTINKHPELSITKNGPASLAAGQQINYLLQIVNNGISDAVGAEITDVVPATVSQVQWTVQSVSGGAVVTAGNTGTGNNVQLTANIPAAASLLVAITGKVDSTYAGNIVNTAVVTPAEPGNLPDTSQVQTAVTLQPNLQISKSGPATLHAGENITYTIVATNNGPSAALNAWVHDAVPTAISPVSWTAVAAGNAHIRGASAGNGNMIDLYADIPGGPGNSITITVTGTVSAAFRDTLNNLAIITPAEPGLPADSSNLVQTVVTAEPQLVIVKTGPATATASQPISYNIIVTNEGLSDAQNFNITDLVPATVTQINWQAATNGMATIIGATSGTGNNISLNGNLPAGAANSIVITVNGIIADNVSGNIVNTATVTPSEPGTSPVQSTVTTAVSVAANLKIMKTGAAVLIRGGQANYTINVVNVGPSNATGVNITDLVPAELTAVHWTATPVKNGVITNGATGQGNNVNITADLPGDTSGILIDVSGLVSQDTPAGQITNIAHATLSTGQDFPSNPVVSAIQGQTNLAITKAGPMEVYEGSTVTYQLTVTNDGVSNADGAVVNDVLPPGLLQPSITVLSASNGAGNIQAAVNGNTATALLGLFPAGASAVLQITAVAPQPGTLSNTAVVNTPAGVPDTDSSNNTSNTVITQVLAKAKLTINKSVNPATGPYTIGQQVTYTLTAVNTGGAGVNPVTITDTLPPAALLSDPAYNSPAQGSIDYNNSTRILKWNVGLLNAGETVSWSYTATIVGAGTIHNTAVITGPPDVSTPDSSTVNITTGKYANLKVLKVLNAPEPLNVNEVLQFVVTAINNGPDSATGVVVQDLLQSMLGVPLSIVTTKGNAVYDPVTKGIIWQLPDMANGTQETLTFTVKLISGGEVINTATIAGNEIDVDLSDNTATVTQPVTGNDIFIPNVITPNGDGKNDYFVVPGIDRYPGTELLIYNRWGNEVYQSKNYDNRWNGHGLSEGTYYYIMKLHTAQGERKYKGWIELMR
ncbi:gliding motility-associated C-terminal domain-containing protein [Chitinophaga sp. 30R24]|uniref:DUF7927 domain-containing protein n=1 Tax=Chitinophaga sp. 30R24 TaxID=3248838 RepID=UPI003B8FE077